jgi:hypothetical protein
MRGKAARQASFEYDLENLIVRGTAGEMRCSI